MNKSQQLSLKAEIFKWIEDGCDFQRGIELYQIHGTNSMLKRNTFIQSRNFPAIHAKLKKELCLIAGIPIDPINPDDIKKKSEIPNSEENTPEQSRETSPDQDPSRGQSHEIFAEKSHVTPEVNPKTPNPKPPRKRSSSNSSKTTSKKSPRNSKS